MTQPYVGGVAKTPFQTFESFDIPWKQDSQASSSEGSIGSDPRTMQSSQASSAPEEESSGGTNPFNDQMFMAMMENQKIMEDYQRQVKQARFFLPRTLQDIAGAYGQQGSYYSSGRRGEMKEAAMKTRFDLQQAKSDAEFQLLQNTMEMKSMLNANDESENTGGRSA